MICQDCRNGYHESCKGATWCPCQHRRPTLAPADVDKVIVEVPPEVMEAIDRILAHPEFLGQMTEYQKAEYEYSVQEEALRAKAATELTQLTQEMGLE